MVTAKWCYNLSGMKKHNTRKFFTPIHLKMPVDMERIIPLSEDEGGKGQPVWVDRGILLVRRL